LRRCFSLPDSPKAKESDGEEEKEEKEGKDKKTTVKKVETPNTGKGGLAWR
jgi:hypothetical protein